MMMQTKHKRWQTIPLLLLLASSLTGCFSGIRQPMDETPSLTEQQLRSSATQHLRVRLMNINGHVVAPLRPILDGLQYRATWDQSHKQLSFGHTDPIYSVVVGSSVAEKAGQSIHLPAAPVKSGEDVWLPLPALRTLFQDDFSIRKTNRGHSIEFVPIINTNNTNPTGQGMRAQSFGDAPNRVNGLTTPTPDIDIDAMLQNAQQYLGVPYVFGSAPYPQSHSFDCSSFVQYVYGQYGVKLKRSSRQQAMQGVAVSPSDLQKGDLLFFSVPGRFKSSRTVGHVAIYMGDQKMIHTVSPAKGGVYIAQLQGTNWERRLLSVRRVAL